MKNIITNFLFPVLLLFTIFTPLIAQDESDKIAFKIAEPDLIPEGIAYDSESKAFYVGSTYKRKIVKIDADGTVSDFTGEAQDGLRSLLGMRVDARRRILWAISEHAGGSVPFKNMTKDCLGCSEVYKYDLKTGKLIKKYSLDNKPKPHFLNDLTITSDGDVYLTNTITGEIFFISHRTDKLEVFHDFGPKAFPNGIDLSADEKRLFVAIHENLAVIDLKSKKSVFLKLPDGVKGGSIDGLYFYRNSLIAIQPFEKEKTIVRFFLNKEQNAVTKMETIESENKSFLQPTTGAIVGKDFYFLANSQLQLFRALYKPEGDFDKSKLADVLVLKLRL